MKEKPTNDPMLYAAMSAPYDNVKQATASLDAFLADVSELRKRHRISDVQVIAIVNYRKKGKVERAGGDVFMGNSALRLPMLAQWYGRARAEHDEALSRLDGLPREEPATESDTPSTPDNSTNEGEK